MGGDSDDEDLRGDSDGAEIGGGGAEEGAVEEPAAVPKRGARGASGSGGRGRRAGASGEGRGAGGAGRGRGRGGRTRADAADEEGADSSSKGKKGSLLMCTDCQEFKGLHEFKPGSSICFVPCTRFATNFYQACRAQNQEDYYKEVKADPKAWKKMKAWYMKNCFSTTGKAKPFKILSYQQGVRNEQAQLRDGVWEMLHLAAFQHWAGKPKNCPPRGLTFQEAEVRFKELWDLPETIFDYEGPNKEYEKRVAVKVRSLIIDRDETARTKSYMLTDGPKKNPNQDAIDAAYRSLHSGFEDVAGATSTMSRKESLQFLGRHSRGWGRAWDPGPG